MFGRTDGAHRGVDPALLVEEFSHSHDDDEEEKEEEEGTNVQSASLGCGSICVYIDTFGLGGEAR